MKIIELTPMFGVYMSNEEHELLNKIGNGIKKSELSEREIEVLYSLHKKDLIKQVKKNGKYIIIRRRVND